MAAECDPNLKPSGNEEVKYTDRGNRCEGFYQSKYTVASLDIIGFAKGKLNYALDDEETVRITLPSKPANKLDTINVRAQAYPLKTYYRLDATISLAGELVWPIKDVLKPKGILSKNIGIFGWYKRKSGTMVYVPLRAEPKKSRVRNDDRLRLFFRSNIDISDVNYMWISCNGVRKQKKYTHINKVYYAGTRILIPLSENISGICYLYVTALIKGRDPAIDDNWIARGIYVNVGGS
jgi:hypothetical protein